jgi:hypothetical protein
MDYEYMPPLPVIVRKKRIFKRGELIILLTLLTALLIYWGWQVYSAVTVRRDNTEAVSSLYFTEPVQTEASGTVTIRIGSIDIQLTKVAEYSISARVIGTRNYRFKTQNRLAPKDVALAWGFLSDESVDDKIKWSMRNRFYTYRIDDGVWLNSIGGLTAIAHNSANNHLIPADSDAARQIRAVRNGDYIRIEGYLVNVYWTRDNGSWFRWNTSTTRTDTGDGACEIIYVTDIKWLVLE